jgi:hypothetical protein
MCACSICPKGAHCGLCLSFILSADEPQRMCLRLETRHAIAYALLAALLIGPLIVLLVVRRSARRDRRDARRPIQITRKKKLDD